MARGKTPKKAKSAANGVQTSDLTKGELRKLNALRKSVGDEIGTKAFKEWYEKRGGASTEDRVAAKLEQLLRPALKDKSLNLGRHGYTVRRAKGRGAGGLQVTRNEKPAS